MNREEIVARGKQRQRESLDAANWGEGLYVQSLTARERLDFELWCEGDQGADGEKGLMQMARLLVCCVVDGDGKPVFRDAAKPIREDDLAKASVTDLLEFSPAVVRPAWEKACAMNALRQRDLEAVKGNS